MFDPASNSAPYIADGRLRPIVVPAPRRTASLPNISTSAEADLPGYEVITWFALFGPAEKPADVVTRINTLLKLVLVEREAVQRLAVLGLEPTSSTPFKAATCLEADHDKWGELIRRIGLVVE